jgi:hypothetical protein
MHGLEIRMRGMSMAELDALSKFETQGKDVTTGDRVAEMRAMAQLFSSRLISWNLLDEDGQEVGTSIDDILAADLGVVMSAIGAWQKEVTRVPDPLPQPSSAGLQYRGEPIPMIQDLPLPNLVS